MSNITIDITSASRERQTDLGAVTGIDPKFLVNRKRPCFWDGDVVGGEVVAQGMQGTKARRIFVEVSGVTQCAWSSGTVENQFHYLGHREFIKAEIVLWRAGSGRAAGLPAGINRWPFSFQIPRGSPSSCAATYGGVSYTVQAKVELSNGVSKTLKAVMDFDVEKHVDVTKQALQKPLSSSKSIHVGCWIWKSGPITLRASVNKQGFYYGDTVEVSNIVAQNMSKRNMGHLRVSLDRVSELIPNGGGRREGRDKLAEIRSDDIVRAGDDLSLPPKSFTIPKAGCSVDTAAVRTWIAVRVTLVVPREYFDLTVDLPLVVSPIRPVQAAPLVAGR